MTNRDNILEKAKEIINGDRQGTYGKPEDSFQMISELWSSYLKCDISSVDVANMMVLLKVARNAGGVYKDDNWIDICGYAALGGEIQGRYTEENFGQYMNKPVDERKEFDDDIPYPVKDMTFTMAYDAVRAFIKTKQIIECYGSCSISKYYHICGESSTRYMDEKYGWNDLHELPSEHVIRLSASGEWIIKMPPAVRLGKGENE